MGAVKEKVWYVCMSATCGNTKAVTYAPAATISCPECGGTMKRES